MKWLVGAAALAAALTGGSAAQAAGPKDVCVGNHAHCFASLQAALDNAPEGATIHVDRGVTRGPITILRSVTVQGEGDGTVVQGGGPVVMIGSTTRTPTVTLSHLTITGGMTTTNVHAPNCGLDVPVCGPGYPEATAIGGGIVAFPGTTVTITHSVVTRNNASPFATTNSVKATCPTGPCPASFADGGGIDDGGTMMIDHSVVSDNHAWAVQSNGGGIAVEQQASLTVSNSRVSGNTAEAAPPYGRFVSGGGIYVDGNGDDRSGTLVVENSAITGNTSKLSSSIPHPYPLQDGGNDQSNAFGGGIFANAPASVSISNSDIDSNVVSIANPQNEPFGADAGIASFGGPFSIHDSRLRGNALVADILSSAENGASGGALEVDGAGDIYNTDIRGNTTMVRSATGDAAALGALQLLNFGDADTTVTDSHVVHNTTTAWAPAGTATVQGAAVLNDGSTLMKNVEIVGNRGVARGADGFAQGGGIWNGFIFGGDADVLTLQDTRIRGNSLTTSPGLTAQGGGLYTPGFAVTRNGGEIAGNLPDQCFGC
jgi:hypothetical protein